MRRADDELGNELSEEEEEQSTGGTRHREIDFLSSFRLLAALLNC